MKQTPSFIPKLKFGMYYYEIEDLYFDYDWSLGNIDPDFTGFRPDDAFNKKNGYQVLLFLNEIILKLGTPDIEMARMAEKILNSAAETEVDTIQKAENFITTQWPKWV